MTSEIPVAIMALPSDAARKGLRLDKPGENASSRADFDDVFQKVLSSEGRKPRGPTNSASQSDDRDRPPQVSQASEEARVTDDPVDDAANVQAPSGELAMAHAPHDGKLLRRSAAEIHLRATGGDSRQSADSTQSYVSATIHHGPPRPTQPEVTPSNQKFTLSDGDPDPAIHDVPPATDLAKSLQGTSVKTPSSLIDDRQTSMSQGVAAHGAEPAITTEKSDPRLGRVAEGMYTEESFGTVGKSDKTLAAGAAVLPGSAAGQSLPNTRISAEPATAETVEGITSAATARTWHARKSSEGGDAGVGLVDPLIPGRNARRQNATSDDPMLPKSEPSPVSGNATRAGAGPHSGDGAAWLSRVKAETSGRSGHDRRGLAQTPESASARLSSVTSITGTIAPQSMASPAFSMAEQVTAVVPGQSDTGQVHLVEADAIDPTALRSDVARDPHATLHTGPHRFPPQAQADLAARVADQMTQAARHLPGGPVEITLNPEELGRVRMHLSAADGGLTLMVTSDRPETLDLMRRHIDLLAAEYRALGYASLDFTFGQQGDPSQSGSDPDGTAPDQAMTEEMAVPPPPILPPSVPAAGLDIRI